MSSTIELIEFQVDDVYDVRLVRQPSIPIFSKKIVSSDSSSPPSLNPGYSPTSYDCRRTILQEVLSAELWNRKFRNHFGTFELSSDSCAFIGMTSLILSWTV